ASSTSFSPRASAKRSSPATCRRPRSLPSSRRSCPNDRGRRSFARAPHREAAMSSSTLFNLVLAIVLLGANAFYVAAEFALVKSKGFRIDALAEEGRFGARLTQDILKNIEAYLACCQLGITMASLGLGWVGEPTVAGILTPLLRPLGMPESAVHLTSFLLGFLVFSSLHIVVGEQVPKTLAIREPEPVSQWIAWPLHF